MSTQSNCFHVAPRSASAMRRSVLAAAVAAGVAALTQAAVFQWDGGGANTSWSTSNNWGGVSNNVAPGSPVTNDLGFGSIALAAPNNTTANNTTNNFDVNSITFNGTANASFGLTGSELDLEADGIVQPSIVQNSNLAHSIANSLDVIGTQLTLDGNGT